MVLYVIIVYNIHLLAVIQQVLPNCADLCDPISKQPLTLTPIDIATLSLLVTGCPPFAAESSLKEHFEQEVNGQQIQTIKISEDKETATICFDRPTGKYARV